MTTYSTVDQLMQGFAAHKRHDSFSFEGFEVLFDLISDESGVVTSDVVAIDCQYSELTVQEILYDYVDYEQMVEWAGEDFSTAACEELRGVIEANHRAELENFMMQKTQIQKLKSGKYIIDDIFSS